MLKCKCLLLSLLYLTFGSITLFLSCDRPPSLETKKSFSKNVLSQYPKKVTDTSELKITEILPEISYKKLIYPEKSTSNIENRNFFKKPVETLIILKKGEKLKPDTIYLKNIVPVVLPTVPESAFAKEMASKQQNSGGFTYYDKLQGLKQSFVTCMTEDNAGNLWLGSHGGGLTRFNGKTFTYFTTKEGLANNSIFSVKETTDGKIWIGTFGKGLSIFDGKAFENINTQNGFPTDLIYVILEDKKDNVWIGTEGGGLIQMNKKDHNYILQYNLENGFISDKITSLLEDKDGRIWVGSDGNGLAYIDQENNVIIPDQINTSSLTVTDMTSDREGHVWVSTYGDGLLKFEGNKLLKYQEKQGFPSDLLTCVKIEQEGDIWVGTDGIGVLKIKNIDSQNQDIHIFNSSKGLSNDNVYSILQDHGGTMWFGTNRGGVNKLNPSGFSHIQDRSEFPTHHVSSITEDKNKNIWVSTLGDGIIKLPDLNRNDLNKAVNITTNEGLSNKKIYCSFTDKKGSLWFGTGQGVTIIDGDTIKVLNNENGFCGEKVLTIFQDSKGIYWFGMDDRGGIAYYDGKKITCIKGGKNLFKSAVFTIAEDKDGKIWFGTDREGIIIWDGKDFLTFDKDAIFNKNAIFSILKDAEGFLWIGTEGHGLFVYDGEQFYNINESWGLSNNFVFSIIEDENKDLWFGTRFGLNVLSLDNKKRILKSSQNNKNDHAHEVYFQSYGYEDGFLGIGCNRNALYQTSDNRVWIGTSDRLTISHLADSKNQNNKDSLFNELHFTSLELFNEKVNWIEFYNKNIKNHVLSNSVIIDDINFSGLSSWYNMPEELSLKHNNNYLTFYFTAISQVQPWKIKYQYKMTGLKEDWSAWNYSNTAHYGHLSPGRYTLEIRAMDSRGNLSETIAYPFEIRHPWWSTLWMKIIYLLTFSAFIYYIHISQKNKTIKNERLLSQAKELEQAKEIEQAYKELKSTQAQLIQSEKMASLGELTAGIAHEIQNPLNFVNNFSEVSNELIVEVLEERKKEKGERDEALEEEILSDIKENLTKINHHGQRASSIVKGMLEHSRKSSGTKEPTDINALCDEYLRFAYHGLRAKDSTFNAAFETHFDSDLPKIDIIPQEIGRVILNIINNAFYAVSEKSKVESEKSKVESEKLGSDYQPKVSVSTKGLGDKIEISICDNGSGIPEHIKDKIFQPFFTTKPTGQGTGLGLSLSYDIVKAHGGELKVETKDGVGSDFIILLPLS
jgi:signal transduction histidine kinase/ligand-binding sensor domain-containing protein